MALGLGWAAHALHGHPDYGRDFSFTVLAGALFGVLLQRSRFCFAAAFRDLLGLGERRLMLGLLCALAVGSAGYTVIFGAWVPDPTAGYMPPRAHIAPAGWHLLLGGASFGLGMVVAGGCISGHLYRLGEGSLASLLALFATVPGFWLGYLAWNRLYVAEVATAPVEWLPARLGYGGALAMQLGVIAALAAALLLRLPGRATPAAAPLDLAGAWRRVAREPWPPWLAGAALGVLGAFTFLRTQPLGVTAELGRRSRDAGDLLGLLPSRLEGLDALAGCRPPATELLLSQNGVLVTALVLGSLLAALAAGEFRPRLGRPRALLRAAGGGVLLGFGAMVSLGCTIGTLLSGTMALSLSGWVFGGALLLGAGLGVAVLGPRRGKRSAAPAPGAGAAHDAQGSRDPRGMRGEHGEHGRGAPAEPEVLDLRGEACGVPAGVLERSLAERAGGRPLRVLGDHRPALEPLEPIAARHGWSIELRQDAAGAWLAELTPPPRTRSR